MKSGISESPLIPDSQAINKQIVNKKQRGIYLTFKTKTDGNLTKDQVC